MSEVSIAVDELKRAVDGYLSVLAQQGKWYGWRNATFKGMVMDYGTWATSEVQGDKRCVWTNRVRSLQTGRVGCPDIVGIFKKDTSSPGVFVGIEMKTGGAKQTVEQIDAGRTIKYLGGLYIVCRSVADLEAVMVPRRIVDNSIDISDIPF